MKRKQSRLWLGIIMALAVTGAAAVLAACSSGETHSGPTEQEEAQTYPEKAAAFREKEALLRQEALPDWVQEALGSAPAGDAGFAAFFSVCDGQERARVYSASGATLEEAWDASADRAAAALERSGLEPKWVKADLVYHAERLPDTEVEKALAEIQPGFFRYGLAFDSGFGTALLEEELNGAQIFSKESSAVDLSALNRYLESAGREPLDSLPEAYTMFGSAGWFCGEDNVVWKLDVGGPGSGRRTVDTADGTYVRELIRSGAGFLSGQIQEDGSFANGWYPQFDEAIQDGGVMGQAGALWSLVCCYRLVPDEALAERIDCAAAYLTSQLGFDEGGRAFLYEEDEGEIRLGSSALALLALAEYTDVFQTSDYLEDCRALGGGIISMLDPETGTFVHVLNGDLSRKEAFRTSYYDGEAVFALCRLYGITGEQIWLDASRMAADHILAADEGQYTDHWAAYAVNELTKYVTDNADYYIFALKNAQISLQEYYERETASPACLEHLMAVFELYDRMTEGGGSAEGFALPALLKTIYTRVERQMDGYFYPEYAMYMQNPQRVAGAFMVRQDGFRVRIDDVQHNLSGLCMYAANYDRLTASGMLETLG